MTSKLPPLNFSRISKRYKSMQQLGRDNHKKIIYLIDKARATGQMKEKDVFVGDAFIIWNPLTSDLERIISENETKNSSMNILKTQIQDAQNQLRILKRNTKFVFQEANIKKSTPESTLVKEINELESQLKHFISVSRPEKVKNYSNTPKPLFSLIDLKLRRLEELSFGLKKRLIAVEESDINSEEISKYGGLTSMLKVYEKLRNKNIKLKEKESKFIFEFLTRRRNLSKLGSVSNRLITLLLQKQIQLELDVIQSLEEHNFKVNYKTSENFFEDTIHDPFFDVVANHFESAEFGNTFETELIDQLIVAESPVDRKIRLQKLIEIQSHTNDKISAEIEEIKSKFGKPIVSATSSNRTELALVENYKSFTNFTEISDGINETIKHNESLFYQVQKQFHVKKIYQLEVIEKTAKLRDLFVDHNKLTRKVECNLSVLRTLLHLTCVHGLRMVGVETSHLDLYLLAEISEENNRNGHRILDTPSFDDQESMLSSHQSGDLPIFTLRKRNKKSRFVSRKCSPAQSVCFNDPFKYLTPVEFFHLLCLIFKLAGFSIGINVPYLTEFKLEYDRIQRGFINNAKLKMKNFQGTFFGWISTIRKSSLAILVKEKNEAEVNTDPLPRDDINIQTDDPPAPPSKKRK